MGGVYKEDDKKTECSDQTPPYKMIKEHENREVSKMRFL